MSSLPLEVIKRRGDKYLSQGTYQRDSCMSAKIPSNVEIPGFLRVPDNITGKSSQWTLFSHLQIEQLSHREVK